MYAHVYSGKVMVAVGLLRMHRIKRMKKKYTAAFFDHRGTISAPQSGNLVTSVSLLSSPTVLNVHSSKTFVDKHLLTVSPHR